MVTLDHLFHKFQHLLCMPLGFDIVDGMLNNPLLVDDEG